MKKIIIISISVLILIYAVVVTIKKVNWNLNHSVGEKIDSLNGVNVYYNGGVGNSTGRNLTDDGYNLGMKYQCVEFIKRYYYQYLKHKMPDSYGNALDFYDKTVGDGKMNEKRNLIQFSNPSKEKPKENDIIIYNKSLLNPYGHVAIISKVEENFIEIIQQNPGPFSSSRENIKLQKFNGQWFLENDRILGRLAKKNL
ncbi:CHAP domain-containing protein [Flavobacterium sp. GN10]|uniref:CHAP domain-containing protein n=1 Tax=Flavobacterium tagetis TaxID=2801336 RepID=A0ABS1KCJ7_9FLAO|nr:CHAP domain-containing protein [Flavobacterium tagetis]MBL0737201.1 CHAP domain-containing protein [Flavobacterium tagetis]